MTEERPERPCLCGHGLVTHLVVNVPSAGLALAACRRCDCVRYREAAP